MDGKNTMTKDEKDEIKELILNELKDLFRDNEALTAGWSKDLEEFREIILKRIENKLRKLNG